MTCVKKYNSKNHKLTCDTDFNTVWSKLTVMTKLNHLKNNNDQIERKKT